MLLFRVPTHGQLVNQWFPSLSSITSHSFLCPIKPNQLAVACCLLDEKSNGPMSKTASIPISSSCYAYLGIGASTTNIAEATWDRTTTDSRVVRGTQGPLGGETIEAWRPNASHVENVYLCICRYYIYIYLFMDIHCFANAVWPDFFVSHHSSVVGITNYGWWKLGVVIRRGFDLQVMWCQDIWSANYKDGPKN